MGIIGSGRGLLGRRGGRVGWGDGGKGVGGEADTGGAGWVGMVRE